MKKSLIVLSFLLLTLVGCKKSYEIVNDPMSFSLMPSTILYIYGGNNEEDYLGKLNANKYDSESIWNEYGKYGNKYNTKCIWNAYGTYGSEYRSYSPFNDYASFPPVLRDIKGNFYGYFTSNKYKTNRANYGIVDIICENYEAIRDDITGWHDKIFY